MPVPRQGAFGETRTHQCKAHAAQSQELDITDLFLSLFKMKIIRTVTVGQGGLEGSMSCSQSCAALSDGNLSHVVFFLCILFSAPQR